MIQDFDYTLPKERIALYPEKKRSDAKLLVVDRKTGAFQHRIFRDVREYLKPGDLLVLNDTKVIPARLFGVRPTGGRVEALLLKEIEENVWEMLIKPSGRIKKGIQILFGDNGFRLEGKVLDEPDGETGIRKIRFDKPSDFFRYGSEGDTPACLSLPEPSPAPVREILNQIGRTPLPPYINRPDEEIDRELYQTVFAQKKGAVASPTAGLHFDHDLLNALEKKGIEICFVTLHVSYGTFQSVEVDDFSKHQMYEEEFEITQKAARQIERAKSEKRRIIACGTTVVRVLETIGSKIEPMRGKTKLFIYPPYEFKWVDILITNFHLPRTTLLMLTSAFGGRDLIFKAYQEAIRRQYRFYSYGDAMLIL